jgi:hypothetical protein
MATSTRVELPPPRSEPLAGNEALARLSAGQRAAAEKLLAGEDVYLVARTRTRTDVGGWLGGSQVVAAALAGELLLLAAPRCPLAVLLRLLRLDRKFPPPGEPVAYAERIPFRGLSGSTYNHVTGQLLLAPADEARIRRLKLPALDAYRLLAQILPEKRNTEDA